MQKDHVIIVHPLHDPGITAQIQPFLEAEFPNLDVIEVCPTKGSIAKAADWNYEQLAAAQRKIFTEEIEPVLEANPMALVTYFGIAPIPLILHLGFLFNMRKVNARNRTHKDQSWKWQGREQSDAPFEIIIEGRPVTKIPEKGAIVMIVETSFKVDDLDVAKVVPDPIASVCIRLKVIGRDELKEEQEMLQVAQAFQDILDQLWTICHPDSEVHLFAGIPAGLAFLMGSKIHSSSHHKVITYKYVPDRAPFKHLRALTIGMHAPEPVKILFVAANPTGTESLDLEGEFQAMLTGIKGAWQAAHVEIEALLNATTADLVKKLVSFQPTILHYAGHGSRSRGVSASRDLLLQDASGNAVPRSGEDLGVLLGSLNLPIQLLVLNACHSAGMIDEVLPHVGCVIAMQEAVQDEASVVFAETLYLLLANGKTVREAFGGACFSMDLGHRMPTLVSGMYGTTELRIVG